MSLQIEVDGSEIRIVGSIEPRHAAEYGRLQTFVRQMCN